MSQRKVSETEQILQRLANDAETDPKTRHTATKYLGELVATRARIELARARQKARDTAQKETRKHFGID